MDGSSSLPHAPCHNLVYGISQLPSLAHPPALLPWDNSFAGLGDFDLGMHMALPDFTVSLLT